MRTAMTLTGRSVALMRFATCPNMVRSSLALTMRAAATLLSTSNVTCKHRIPSQARTRGSAVPATACSATMRGGLCTILCYASSQDT